MFDSFSAAQQNNIVVLALLKLSFQLLKVNLSVYILACVLVCEPKKKEFTYDDYSTKRRSFINKVIVGNIPL